MAECSPDAYTDPLCPGNIKNLWLDVVVVVDRSQLMTNSQLWQVRNTISQVFGAVDQIGPVKYPQDPRSTCVGVVTYDSNATVAAQMDASKSFSDLYNVIQGSLVAVDSTNISYLSQGLLAAEKVLQDGLSRTYRYNYKRVVIAFASAYQGSGTINDVLPVAKRLKNNGVTIISVACTTDSEAREALSTVASPGYALVDEMNTAKLVQQLTNALLSVNCFCPSDWVQLGGSNTSSPNFAVCVQGFKSTGGNWGFEYAVEYCQGAETNAYLANEFSQQKHDFLHTYMLNKFPAYDPLEYYIGLSYWGNQWYWEQPYKQESLPFNPNGYSAWAPGYPKANSTGQTIANQPVGTTFAWAEPQTFDWLFVCQVQASSTEYYTTYSVM
ncbi:unnamed protein product [Caenorhabditis sp. 36 PRJEB53466]|nr:unnamed protein product [Caenorhabditis sp. 36 PRJEB53466]